MCFGYEARNKTIVFDAKFSHSVFFQAQAFASKPALPFFTRYDKTRRVDTVHIALEFVGPLSEGKLFLGM